MRTRPRSTRSGFTLIELMVVLIIITSVITLGVPTLRKLTEFSRGSAGVNSISVAVNAARIYNHRLGREDLGDALGSGVGAEYSGTAVLFTPAGEIRLVENNQHAAVSSGPPIPPIDYLEYRDLNGYKDIDGVDYVTMPQSGGVVGVIRTGNGPNDLRLIPPPFAIRFNEFGQIVVPPTLTQDTDFIYYDSDYDGVYEIGVDRDNPHRDSSYDPTAWTAAALLASGGVTNDGHYHLPFEKIEVVSAVILFDSRQQRLDQDEYTATSDVQWFLDNGTPLYFSPLTGLVLTNE